jgi:site-specific DNA recombinase
MNPKEVLSITTTEELVEHLNLIHGSKNTISTKDCCYVIYARKSEDDPKKQLRSLADQIIECQEFAEKNNLNVVEDGIIQEAVSAKHPDIRKEFRRMIDGLKIPKPKYDSILAWHPDRLARNMKDAGEIIDLVDKGTIRDLKFVSFGFENSASGKMLLGITFVLSKHYSDSLSDNVSRGNERSILEGKYINKVRHGYYKDSSQYLRPDGENFNLIMSAFEMRLEGKTLEEIAEYLNSKGYTSLDKNGGRFICKMTKQKVEKILKDPVYAGVLMYGKNESVNLETLYDFQPMISVEKYMKINHILKKEHLIRLYKSFRKGADVKSNLMKDMVICGHCGEELTEGITPKKNKVPTNYFYYRCDNEDCPMKGKSTRAKVIINYICDYLEQKPFSSMKSYEHYQAEMKRVSQQRANEAREGLLALRGQLAKTEDRKLKIKEWLLNEKDDEVKKDFRRDFDLAKDDIKHLEEEIKKKELLVNASKESLLAYAEFLELMEKVPKIMGKIKNMSELDFIIRKIFLNFTIKDKKVIKSTLNSPFDVLETQKDLTCGQERT